MDRGAWWAYGPWDHKKNWRRLSDQTTKQQSSVAETVKYSASFLCWPFIFLTALWRYNSCTTHLNHPIHWFWAYSQNCATVTSQRNPDPWVLTFPPPVPSIPKQPLSYFLLFDVKKLHKVPIAWSPQGSGSPQEWLAPQSQEAFLEEVAFVLGLFCFMSLSLLCC